MEQNYRETVRSNSDTGTTNATVRLLSGVVYDCQLLLSHKTEKDLAVKGYVQLVAEALAAKQDTLQDFLSTMKGLTAAEDKAKLAISNLKKEVAKAGKIYDKTFSLHPECDKEDEVIISEVYETVYKVGMFMLQKQKENNHNHHL